jgi:hypothetical protein
VVEIIIITTTTTTAVQVRADERESLVAGLGPTTDWRVPSLFAITAVQGAVFLTSCLSLDGHPPSTRALD